MRVYPFPPFFHQQEKYIFFRGVGGGEEVEMLGGVINKLEGVFHVKLREEWRRE